MKCENCDNEATFVIKNLRKDDTMYFCDMHFWEFCVGMTNAYKEFGVAIKEIDKML